MVDKAENNEKSQNYVELTESQIFEKIKNDLDLIQKNLSKESQKRITINEAKSELKKINEWLQGTKLEKKDKKDLGEAFNKLEQNIDKNNSKAEFNEIIKILEKLTKKDLANLNREVQQNSKQRWNPERTIEVQDGIDTSSNNFEKTVHEASKDKNLVARIVGERMENLMA